MEPRNIVAIAVAVVSDIIDEQPYISEGVRSLYDDAERGERKTRELLESGLRLQRYCRCNIEQFKELVSLLSLKDGRYVSKEQQLLITLRILAYGYHFRCLQEDFHHSSETVSRWFHHVLNRLVILHRELVKPGQRDDSKELRFKRNSEKYWPRFRGAIGALDGSQILALICETNQAPYRNKKGTLTQNVLAAVDFNMRFTFVLAGWEGSAHDSRVLASAKTLQEGALQAPKGCYYLADAGYTNTAITLVPYRGVRYHLKEQYRSQNKPENAKELFNLRHSSLRNVIERAFGVLKKRFEILSKPPSFKEFETQIKVVYACTALHNFLIDWDLQRGVKPPKLKSQRNCDNHYNGGITGALQDVADARKARGKDGGMTRQRDRLAEVLWTQYKGVISVRSK
jgi:hypothetical protein